MNTLRKKLSFRSMAKFDAIVAKVRSELSYPFEGLQVPPPCWEDEAYLAGRDKQLVLFAGVDEEVLRNFPYQKVALRDFVVAAEDADFPLNEIESRIFAELVRGTEESFEREYQGDSWHPKVARLIVELKLASPADDMHAARGDILASLCDVLKATLILPPLPEPMDLESVDPRHRESLLHFSLFLAAELHLSTPLQELEAVHRIRSCFPRCPASLIGSKVRLEETTTSQYVINFRTRQF